MVGKAEPLLAAAELVARASIFAGVGSAMAKAAKARANEVAVFIVVQRREISVFRIKDFHNEGSVSALTTSRIVPNECQQRNRSFRVTPKKQERVKDSKASRETQETQGTNKRAW